MTAAGNWRKPEDFSTEPKHLVDDDRQYNGVYRTDPEPYLSSIATGR